MNLKPYQDRVIVKPIKHENKSEDGVVFVTAVAQESVRGEVVAVALGDWNDTLVVGSRILFSKYAGEEVIFEDELYKIISLSDVLAYE